MNYTKYLKGKGKKEKFSLSLNDEKVKVSLDILKDIQKTKLIIENFSRIGN